MALLIDRQHDGVIRRIDVEAHDIAQFGGELRVFGQLKLPDPRPSARQMMLIPIAAAMAAPSNGWRAGWSRGFPGNS